jgi:hypothetical protein
MASSWRPDQNVPSVCEGWIQGGYWQSKANAFLLHVVGPTLSARRNAMAGIIRYRNLVIHSIDSSILAIWCHGSYLPRTRNKTTVPCTAALIWHAPEDGHGVLPRGARYITGSRSANDLADWGTTLGGLSCVDYTLLTKLDDPTTVVGPATVDYVTTIPGTTERLSTVWEAMQNKHLDYEEVHYFACRLPQ